MQLKIGRLSAAARDEELTQTIMELSLEIGWHNYGIGCLTSEMLGVHPATISRDADPPQYSRVKTRDEVRGAVDFPFNLFRTWSP